ncbi:hypothetical protein F2P47_08770 [Parvibaculum sedimenti]|uniref:Tyrosine-type recombinase/integrase n=1 Tax=Parvibaculum sedimenti TaxID=2608632 RepID=A0A6N6VGL8_9HYPH|nr:hypothetical protein [Parvibaculum sedimenti]KAB7740096.1 hypothetical protein F2P47_08770 [Parvibaculum sedimenti]
MASLSLSYSLGRPVAGSDLADASESEKEIAAVLGHRTLRMVQNYTKSAAQKRLASSAIKRLERADKMRKSEG